LIERIIISILTKLGSWLLTKGLEWFQKREQQKADEATIDAKVSRVKAAYASVVDGTPMTPEQRREFNAAVSDLIRGNTTGGL